MKKTLIPYEALREKEIPLSKSQIAKLEAQGKFPRRVKLAPKTIRWLESEVDQYVADRIASRNKADAA